jgi:hypothetical protein
MSDLKLIDEVCGLMHPGALYPISYLKTRFREVFRDSDDIKKIAKTLLNENKKADRKVVRVNVHGSPYYTLSDNHEAKDQRVVTDNVDVASMATAIYNMVHSQNIKALDEWLQTNLMSAIEQIVKEEFKNEILPVLQQSIDNAVNNKVKMSKSKFKMLILEIIGDVIKVTDDGEIV